MSPGTSGFHLGEDLFNVGFDCMCPREDGSHERFLSRAGDRGSRSYQGSLLTLSNTHPAAPAIPSPRRRETSFSLPRRMDSRNLENELLRRRVWGGHRGYLSAPSQPLPIPSLEADAYGILTFRAVSPAVPVLAAPGEQMGAVVVGTLRSHLAGRDWGLTERGGQVLPAEDFFV